MVLVAKEEQTIVPIGEAAQRTGIPLRTLQYWVRRRKIKSYRRGPYERVYVDLRELELREVEPESPPAQLDEGDQGAE